MINKKQDLSDFKTTIIPGTQEMLIGIVVSEWNTNITSALLDGCISTLIKQGVSEDNIETIYVPGTFELTTGASLLLNAGKLDGVVCLGCVIKGETKHDEYISHAVANGLTRLALKEQKPVIFGVLTTENMYQAVDRAGGKHGNKGTEAAITVLKMIYLYNSISKQKTNIGF